MTEARAPRTRRIAAARFGRAAVLLAALAGCADSAAPPARSSPATARRILHSPQAPSDFFPIPFSWDGQRALAGARDRDNQSTLFVLDGERSPRVERPADLDSHAFFGRAALLRGDTLFVTSATSGPCEPGHDCRGRVHVFVHDDGGGWTRQSVIESDELPLDRVGVFGAALAFDGRTLVVGAPEWGGQGVAYVLEVQDGRWTRRAVLRPATETRGQAFGNSVALAGDLIVVGAPSSAIGFDEDPTAILGDLAPGRAYVYRRSGASWVLDAELQVASADAFDQVGAAVAVDREQVVVAAPLAEHGRGAVHIFQRGEAGWALQTTLRSEGGPQLFGSVIALEGKVLAVGAPGVAKLHERGAVHVYAHCAGRWARQQTIEDDDPSSNDFGIAVDLAGGELAIARWTNPGAIVIQTVAASCD